MYEMNKCGRDTWKKVLLIFLTAVFVLLTVASCIFTLCRIPIYLTYEEAVEDVRFEKDGYISVIDLYPTEVTLENVKMIVTVTDRVDGDSEFSDDLIYISYRLPWWYDAQPDAELDTKVREYSRLHGDTWYLGSLTNGDDILLYDFAEIDQQTSGIKEYNWVRHYIEYLYVGAFLLGIAAAVIGAKYRQRKVGKVFLSFAAFFLLLSGSCVFVTGGRMAYINPFVTYGLRYFPLREIMRFFGLKYVMIFLVALFSWCTVMSAAMLVKQLRKK